MTALSAWQVLDVLFGISLVVTGIGAFGVFILLATLVAERNRDGDRSVRGFQGGWLPMWPPILFDWLRSVRAQTQGVRSWRVEFALAVACTAFLTGFYLLWAAMIVRMLVLSMSR